MIKEFKEFLMRGNIMDLAVGVIIAGAFGKIVTSLTNDIIMPVVGLLLGKIDFSNMYINLTGGDFPSLDAAKKAGAVVIPYGTFINTVVEFVIVGFVIFMLLKAMMKAQGKSGKVEVK
jgi:large conductance mechanosensitive channel